MLKRRVIKLKLAGALLALTATCPAQAGVLCAIPVEADANACQASAYLVADSTSQLLDCIDSLLDQKRHADALSALTNGLSVHSITSQLLRHRGRTWFSKGNFDCAVVDITAAIEIDPDNHQGYYLRGIVYYFQKQPSLALAELNRAIDLNPSYSDAYLFRGMSHAQLNNLEIAYNDVKRYLVEFPDNPIGKRILQGVEEKIELRKGFGCAIDHASCG